MYFRTLKSRPLFLIKYWYRGYYSSMGTCALPAHSTIISICWFNDGCKYTVILISSSQTSRCIVHAQRPVFHAWLAKYESTRPCALTRERVLVPRWFSHPRMFAERMLIQNPMTGVKCQMCQVVSQLLLEHYTSPPPFLGMAC